MDKGYKTHPIKRKGTAKKRTVLIDRSEFEKTILTEKNRVEKHTILICGEGL